MAKQKSTVQVQGTIGNLTFFKSVDGFMVKAKSEIAREKIFSDPKFERTRENMAEFANAGSSAKIIRLPFTALLQSAADPRMVSRLTSTCLKVVKTDTSGARGTRTVAKGDLSLLAGFDFNSKGIMSSTLLAPFTVTFARTTGNVQFDLPVFVPKLGMAAPRGATHYQLQLAAAAIDLSTSTNISVQAASAILPWDNNPAAALSLTASLPANSTFPVFVLLQVQFMVQVNGSNYSLQNGAYNACSIVHINPS